MYGLLWIASKFLRLQFTIVSLFRGCHKLAFFLMTGTDPQQVLQLTEAPNPPSRTSARVFRRPFQRRTSARFVTNTEAQQGSYPSLWFKGNR